jgi:hypothetical protein
MCSLHSAPNQAGGVHESIRPVGERWRCDGGGGLSVAVVGVPEAVPMTASPAKVRELCQEAAWNVSTPPGDCGYSASVKCVARLGRGAGGLFFVLWFVNMLANKGHHVRGLFEASESTWPSSENSRSLRCPRRRGHRRDDSLGAFYGGVETPPLRPFCSPCPESEEA